MKAEEFLLRFLTLHFDFDNYEKPLAAFLNTFVEKHRDANETQLGKSDEAVLKAVDGVEALSERWLLRSSTVVTTIA